MILQDAQGNTYRAHFRHTLDPEGPKIYHRGMSSRWRENARWWATTECTLHAGPCATNQRPCGTESSYGISKCSRSDNFDRRLGLKRSFEMALHRLFPNDAQHRGELWASFWTRVRRPKHG